MFWSKNFSVDLDFLLCCYGVMEETEKKNFALRSVGETLQSLLRGGIHDHIGKVRITRMT